MRGTWQRFYLQVVPALSGSTWPDGCWRREPAVGAEKLKDYYDVRLKADRFQQLQEYDHFSFLRANLEDREAIGSLFAGHAFFTMIHLVVRLEVCYSKDEMI